MAEEISHPKVAKLVPPHMDKNWSFQMHNVSEDDVDKVKSLFTHETVRKTTPFLQGNSQEWLMVEFWCRDKAWVDASAKVFFDAFGLPFKEGPFTREDLGLN